MGGQNITNWGNLSWISSNFNLLVNAVCTYYHNRQCCQIVITIFSIGVINFSLNNGSKKTELCSYCLHGQSLLTAIASLNFFTWTRNFDCEISGSDDDEYEHGCRLVYCFALSSRKLPKFQWCLQALMMVSVSISKTSVSFYQTARHNVPQDRHLQVIFIFMFRTCNVKP
jgi:hypothetical protein